MNTGILQERAKRGDRKAFEKALSRVPDTESEPLDRIDAGAGKPRVRAKRPKPSRKSKGVDLVRRARST